MTGPSAESAARAETADSTHNATHGNAPVPAVLASAVVAARTAITDVSGADTVGDHLGVDYEDATAASHRFEATLPGYHGWQWAVVVAAAPDSDHATISEVVLVPGPAALLAPEWVPWDQRIEAGDLGPGDLLPKAKDDPRLVPGYTATGDPAVDDVAAELGLGRRWVVSPEGRAGAARRWHSGEYGPNSAMARSTKRKCRDCGFFVPLGGALGRMFGACLNEFSADGRVVDAEYGCGAHSDVLVPTGSGSPVDDPYDDDKLDLIDRDPETPEPSGDSAGAMRPQRPL